MLLQFQTPYYQLGGTQFSSILYFDPVSLLLCCNKIYPFFERILLIHHSLCSVLISWWKPFYCLFKGFDSFDAPVVYILFRDLLALFQILPRGIVPRFTKLCTSGYTAPDTIVSQGKTILLGRVEILSQPSCLKHIEVNSWLNSMPIYQKKSIIWSGTFLRTTITKRLMIKDIKLESRRLINSYSSCTYANIELTIKSWIVRASQIQV